MYRVMGSNESRKRPNQMHDWKVLNHWINEKIIETLIHKYEVLSRICSLPWQRRHQVWPWWQRRLERGGWCWKIFVNWWHMGDKMVTGWNIFCTYSPVITTSGDWTQIFAILYYWNSFYEILIFSNWGLSYKHNLTTAYRSIFDIKLHHEHLFEI